MPLRMVVIFQWKVIGSCCSIRVLDVGLQSPGGAKEREL